MAQKLKTFALTALAGAAMAISASASAITLTNSDGSFSDWGGFDWAENGSIAISGYDPTFTASNAAFDVTFFADAVSVSQEGGGSLVTPTIGLLNGNYEYTIVATLNESATCNAFSMGICADASFGLNSGSFKIYYDESPDADLVAGTGLNDGILLIEGTIIPGGSGGFNVITGGNSVLEATIDMTNLTYINPALEDSIAFTTIQVAGTTTNWTEPTGVPIPDTNGLAGPVGPGDILLQADGNQTFTATTVPEPGVLALLGVAMLGMAATRRRKSVK